MSMSFFNEWCSYAIVILTTAFDSVVVPPIYYRCLEALLLLILLLSTFYIIYQRPACTHIIIYSLSLSLPTITLMPNNMKIHLLQLPKNWKARLQSRRRNLRCRLQGTRSTHGRNCRPKTYPSRGRRWGHPLHGTTWNFTPTRIDSWKYCRFKGLCPTRWKTLFGIWIPW